MIQRTDLLAFNFYKKEKFTGSYKGMRYRIEKLDKETDDHKESIFLVTTWPGPYNYASTDETLRTEKAFPFKEDALIEITDYLNQTYEEKKEDWPTRIY